MPARRPASSPLALPAPRRVSAIVLTLAPALALAGCGSGTGQVFAPSCARPAILAQASDLTRFSPAGHDVTDMVLDAKIEAINGKCAPASHHTLDTTVRVALSVTRGPASRARHADIPYFVAVTRGGTILDKEILTQRVTFSGNSDQANVTGKKLRLRLPIPPGVHGSDYRLLVGFQLTQAELAYNRQRTAP
ncbi:MAG TPA: hypothetical protein VMU82_14335 [Acetobacteraceae bacterium]|nr:hypothetical protein [Acetobacteraceae bacterium]